MFSKKFLAALTVLSCFAALSFSENFQVTNEEKLLESLIYNSGNIFISSSITISSAMPMYSSKDFNILPDASSPIFVSGAGSFGGFAFEYSTVSFIGANNFELNNFVYLSSGAALYVYASTLSLSGVSFSTNASIERAGGAVYADSSTALVSTTSFLFNASSSAGGAFYAQNSTLAVLDSVFHFNVSSGLGGAVYIEKGIFDFNGVSFSSNAADKGSAVYVFSSSGVLNNSTISGGKSTDGNLYASSSAIFLRGVKFHENEASNSGGAAFIKDSQIYILNSLITDNKAFNAGGFYIENSEVIIFETGFSNNFSTASAGAIYLSTSSLFLSETTFSSNVSLGNGGALYIENSTASISGSHFSNNVSNLNGGAIYLKSAQLYLNGGVNFNDNFAQGAKNDIYLDEDAKLFLDAQGKEIIFNGGIKSNSAASGIEITKTGGGSLIFCGESSLNAFVNVSGGSLIVSQTALFDANEVNIAAEAALSLSRGTVVNISTLTINENAVFKTDNISSFNADILNMNGVLRIGVDTSSGSSDLINARTLNLNSSSSALEFDGNLSRSVNTYTIVQTTNPITGAFKETSGNYGARINWSIVQSPNDVKLNLAVLSYADILEEFKGNQINVIKTIDAIYYDSFDKYDDLWSNVISPMDAMSIEDLQKTASALSGSIYADLFSISLLNRSKESLFERINVSEDDNASWIFAKGDIFSLKQDENLNGDLKDLNLGLAGGFSLYDNAENLSAGVMFEYDYHNVEQNKDEAKIHDISGGFYGDILWKFFELKGFLTAGFMQYDVIRNITPLAQTAEGDFAAYNAKAALRAAVSINAGDFLSIKPFIGADGVFLKTSSFDESGEGAQLHFGERDFIASTYGCGLEFKGKAGIFSWFINGGADFVISASEKKIETNFVQAKDAAFEIIPSKLGDTALKTAAGFEIKINDETVIFMNAGYVSSDSYEDIKANLGFRYKLDYDFSL
ncbi:MAG: autotransporter domain-containing protein [Endomicrobium sp.]|nr:autotransporter domain-containing protein [Endomicrobium sp.]